MVSSFNPVAYSGNYFSVSWILGSPFTNCTKDRATHSSLSERNILNWSLLPEEKIQKQFSYFFLRVKYRSSQQTARHPARVGSGRPSPCEISLFSLSTPALKYCSALDMMVTFVVSLVTCNDKLIAFQWMTVSFAIQPWRI